MMKEEEIKPAKPAEKPAPQLTADEINAKQIEEAKAAGKEYQGKESFERPSVKDLATEKA